MSTPTNRTINIYINQAAAERSMESLQKQADKLTEAIHKGEKAGKDMSKEVEKLGATKTKMKELGDIIDGKVGPPLRMVKRNVEELRRELEGMSKDAPGYAAKFEAFRAATVRLTELRREMHAVGEVAKETESKSAAFWRMVKGVAVGTLIGNTTQAAAEAVSGYFSGLLTGAAKLSDELADIKKATGLSASEVQRLNSSLSKIDTRTSTGQLREIAVGLGQIGEAASPETIANIDKIVVALGDEFGDDAGSITTALGTLRNNLLDLKTANYGDDVLRIGNALNELGANGLATAPVITDMANRMSGIAGTFKLTSGELFGVAATFQELGIESERGTTAFNKLLQRMASDTEKFAHVASYAGVSSAEFTRLVNEDMLGALQKVAEGARKAGADNQSFGTILKDLDADGSGAGEVLSKLAANAEMVSAKVNLATKSLQETGSITEEFNTKNTNLAATMEKLGKTFRSVASSRPVTEFLEGLVRGLVVVVAMLPNLLKWIQQNSTALIFFTAAVVANSSAGRAMAGWTAQAIGWLAKMVTGVRSASAAQIANTVVTRAWTVAKTAAAGAAALFTGNIGRAAAAWRVMTAAIGTNPLGALLVVVGAIALAVSQLTRKTREMAMELRLQADLAERVASSTQGQITATNVLTQVLKNNSLSLDEKRKALAKLIELNPEYLQGLTLENINTAEGTRLLNLHIDALRRRAKAESAGDMLEEVYKKQREIDKQLKRLDTIPTEYRIGLIAQRGSLAVEESTLLREMSDNAISPGPTPQGSNESGTGGGGYTPFKDKDKDKDDGADEAARILERFNEFSAEMRAAAESGDELEIQKAREKYDRLEADAKAFHEKKGKWVIDTVLLQGLEEADVARIRETQRIKAAESEYDAQLLQTGDFYEKQRQEAAEAFVAGEIGEKEHSDRLTAIARDEHAVRAVIAADYAKDSKKAAKDLEDAKTKALQDGVDERKRIEADNARSATAKAQMRLLQARKGSQEELDARLDLLRDQHEKELRAGHLNAEEKLLAQAQFQEASKELERQWQVERIQLGLDMAVQLAAIAQQFVDAANARDNAELARDRKRNDEKKRNYQKQLDGKRITKAQYDKWTEKADDDLARKEHAAKVRQFKRDKTMALINVAISTSQAIMAAVAKFPLTGGLPFSGIAAALGITQAGIIAGQKPPELAKGGRLSGSSHAGGGIAMIDNATGQQVAEAEGGEGYLVLSKETMRNNGDLFDALLDASMYGGGKRVSIPWLYESPPQPMIGDLARAVQNTRSLAAGGVVGTSGRMPSTSSSSATLVLPDGFMDVMIEFTSQMKQGMKVKADVYWNEIDQKNKDIAALRAA